MPLVPSQTFKTAKAAAAPVPSAQDSKDEQAMRDAKKQEVEKEVKEQ